MNRKLLNMHIDNATPKKWTRKEKIISMLECLLILILTTTFIFLLSISDIIEGYLTSL
jgi:hypothetical protein